MRHWDNNRVRTGVRAVVYVVAGLLLIDALLALVAYPSLMSGGELTRDRAAKVALALLVAGNIVVTARPGPAGIAISGAALAGAIAANHHRDAGTMLWIVASAMICAIAFVEFLAGVRAERVDAIHARIEEELVDRSSVRPRSTGKASGPQP